MGDSGYGGQGGRPPSQYQYGYSSSSYPGGDEVDQRNQGNYGAYANDPRLSGQQYSPSQQQPPATIPTSGSQSGYPQQYPQYSGGAPYNQYSSKG